MTKVKLAKITKWNDKLCRPGEIVSVDEKIASRWERSGLASRVTSPQPSPKEANKTGTANPKA